MRLSARLNPLLLALLAFGGLLTLCAWLAGGPSEILGTLPLLLLLVALAFDRYPGERLIERLGRRFQRRPRPTSVALPARHSEPLGAHFVAYLAAVLPQRGPPLLSSRSS